MLVKLKHFERAFQKSEISITALNIRALFRVGRLISIILCGDLRKFLVGSYFMSKHPKPLPTPKQHEPPPNSERTVFDTAGAAKYLGNSAVTLERWRCFGIGPKWFKVGPKNVRYLQSDLDAFILVGYRTSTSDAGPKTATLKAEREARSVRRQQRERATDRRTPD